MIRLVLADDEPLIRAGLRTILGSADDVEVVAEAHDGAGALEAVARHRPDVALLDIRMPAPDGIAVAAELRRRGDSVAPVMLTTFGDEENVARALAVDVAGFLLKSGDPHELLLAVRAVAAGGAWLSPPVTRRVLRRVGADRMAQAQAASEAVAALTPRERDVLALVAVGEPNDRIARRLHLAPATVKAHMTVIMRRLGAGNRVQAAVVAHRAGLVPEE